MEHLIRSPETVVDGAVHFNSKLQKLELLSKEVASIKLG